MHPKEWEKEKNRTNVLYKIEFDNGKVYFGITKNTLNDRIRQHVRNSLNNPSQNSSRDIFINPYKRYRGLKGHINSLTTKLDIPDSFSDRKRNDAVYRSLIEKVEIVGSYEGSELRAAEQNCIDEQWVEDPTKLLNYAQLPVHKRQLSLEFFLKSDDDLYKVWEEYSWIMEGFLSGDDHRSDLVLQKYKKLLASKIKEINKEYWDVVYSSKEEREAFINKKLADDSSVEEDDFL
jgi:hypothetical protein